MQEVLKADHLLHTFPTITSEMIVSRGQLKHLSSIFINVLLLPMKTKYNHWTPLWVLCNAFWEDSGIEGYSTQGPDDNKGELAGLCGRRDRALLCSWVHFYPAVSPVFCVCFDIFFQTFCTNISCELIEQLSPNPSCHHLCGHAAFTHITLWVADNQNLNFENSCTVAYRDSYTCEIIYVQ